MRTRPLATGIAGALALLSALHVTWAFSTWPLPDRSRFAEVVVGTDPDRVPSAGATLTVAGLLASAALLVVRCAAPGPRGSLGRIAFLGTRSVAGVLVARAVGGFVVSGGGLVDAPRHLSTARPRRLLAAVPGARCLRGRAD